MLKWIVSLALVLPLSALAARPSAEEILRRIDDLYRGRSSHARMTMKVVTKHYTRELELEAWSRGAEQSFVRILSPAKERGTATLKSGKNIWNYLPKVRRVIKVPSSMMGGAWMGSHLSNDDLVRESRMSEDFEFEITFEGERDGQALVEITCTPKENAAVVWGKVVVEVRKPDRMPVRTRYFDEELKLARTIHFDQYEEAGGRLLPMRMRVRPADAPDEYTEVRYANIAFDISVPDALFTLRNLQR